MADVVDLVVANHAEFNRLGMGGGFSLAQRRSWDVAAHALGEQALLWGERAREGRRRVVLPRAPVDGFVEDIANSTGGSRKQDGVEVHVADAMLPFVSRGVDGPEVVERLMGDASLCRIYAWGSTPGLYRLIETIGQSGRRVQTPELPNAGGARLAHELDGKAGFREFMERSAGKLHCLNLPPGRVVHCVEDIFGELERYAKLGKGAVVKADRGAGGYTVRIFTVGQLAGSLEVAKQDISVRARFDGFWRSPPYVVEQHIAPPPGYGSLAFTTDWVVEKDGSVREVGTGPMKIVRGSLYSGVLAGRGALTSKFGARAKGAGREMGRLLACEGYRGWFDLDLVSDETGALYATEVNLRRTSPAHAFDTARRRWGGGWQRRGAVFSDDSFAVDGCGIGCYRSLRSSLKGFNLDHRDDGMEAIISMATITLGLATPRIGVVITAEHAHCALEGAKRLKGLIGVTDGCVEEAAWL